MSARYFVVYGVILAIPSLAACGVGLSLDPAADRDKSKLQDGSGSEREDGQDDAEIATGDEITSDSSHDVSLEAGDDGGHDAVGSPPSDRSADGGSETDAPGDNDDNDDVSDDGDVGWSDDVRDERNQDSATTLDRSSDQALDLTIDQREAGAADNSGLDIDDARDGSGDKGPDGCAVDCAWPDADYYVSARAAEGGDGSRQKPFITISAAIEAFSKIQGQPKRAYVDEGTYDEALGEHFPLTLRGLSLEGAGQDKTLIVGAGDFDHAAMGGAMNGQYRVTIVAGERQLATKISNLSLRTVAPVPAASYHGIFCDRGNSTGEVKTPAGQTILDRITAGPGYHATVVATTSTSPALTGCNIRITGSTLTGGWTGLFASGCGAGTGSVPVLVEMGDEDPKNGNTISWMQAPFDSAYGVLLGGCVTRGSFQFNSIVHNIYGINVDANTSPPLPINVFTFKHNTFENLTAGGLSVAGAPVFVDEVSDNRFVNITRAISKDGLQPSLAFVTALMTVGKVRRNQFIGNDSALWLMFGPGAGTPADFGTPSDPGNNVFRCNSAVTGIGADVWVYGDPNDPASNWAGTIPFSGNAWDHVPPSLQTGNDAAQGIDISLSSGPNVNFDLSNPTLAVPICPDDRVPGPSSLATTAAPPGPREHGHD